MVGKKAQKDIQFYMEVGEVQTDLNQARGRSDRDEMEREQQERRLKMKLSKTFEAFFKRIEEETNSHVDFEVPIYHLGFSGMHAAFVDKDRSQTASYACFVCLV
jgi:nucleosome binding factor SPN SPT16 subunit